MKKTCENLGPDLLMLVHDDLKGWPRLRMELHLVGCSECRRRRKKMGSLSVSLAHVFQNPRLGYRTFRAAPSLVWASMAVAALFVGGAGVLTANAVHAADTASVTAAGDTGASLRSCDSAPDEKATALAHRKKLDNRKRKHDNPDK